MATGRIFNVPIDMLRDSPVALDSMFDDSDANKHSSQLRASKIYPSSHNSHCVMC